ncbi:hypothetical protein PC5_00001 [Campylobacter phage PC5]|uniref:Tail tube protein n=1 Tax=Campylobacter phage PC5 TaxID=1541690 RepID=A0A1B0XVH9_9CAUD|nr:hypothetical protein PC5_00001 [Campylobacter phage PC5]
MGILNTAVGAISDFFGGNKTQSAITELAQKIQKAYGTNFDLESLYSIDTFALKNEVPGAGRINILDLPNMDILIQRVSIDPISFAEINEWIGSSWVYTQGRHELQQLTITFRDSDGGFLYSAFKKLAGHLKDQYPDDQMWTIKIRKRTLRESRNYINQSVQNNEFKNGGHVIIDTQCAMIRSHGGLSLDQNSNGLATFDVTFLFDPFPPQISY